MVQVYKASLAASADESMQDVLQKVKKRAAAKTSNKDVRDQLISKVGAIASRFAHFREGVIVGFNHVCRTMERGEVAVVCLARKANDLAIQFLLEACMARKIPLVVIPAFSSQLLAALKVKTGFCFALRHYRPESSTARALPADTEELDAMDAAIDDLREYLLSLAL